MKTKAGNSHSHRSTVAPQVVQQSLTVRVVVNDPLAAVAPGHHVIDVPSNWMRSLLGISPVELIEARDSTRKTKNKV